MRAVVGLHFLKKKWDHAENKESGELLHRGTRRLTPCQQGFPWETSEQDTRGQGDVGALQREAFSLLCSEVCASFICVRVSATAELSHRGEELCCSEWRGGELCGRNVGRCRDHPYGHRHTESQNSPGWKRPHTVVRSNLLWGKGASTGGTLYGCILKVSSEGGSTTLLGRLCQ